MAEVIIQSGFTRAALERKGEYNQPLTINEDETIAITSIIWQSGHWNG